MVEYDVWKPSMMKRPENLDSECRVLASLNETRMAGMARRALHSGSMTKAKGKMGTQANRRLGE
jgi:hypothetical protein